MPHQDNILKSLRGKDAHDSFRTLFEEHYGSLISYGISLTGDLETSRELVQDVFLKLWENRDSIRISESLKAYLFKAVFNRAANRARHEKVKRAFEKDGFRELFSDISVNLEITPFLQQAINNAIESLPERARAAFCMRYNDGL